MKIRLSGSGKLGTSYSTGRTEIEFLPLQGSSGRTGVLSLEEYAVRIRQERNVFDPSPVSQVWRNYCRQTVALFSPSRFASIARCKPPPFVKFVASDIVLERHSNP